MKSSLVVGRPVRRESIQAGALKIVEPRYWLRLYSHPSPYVLHMPLSIYLFIYIYIWVCVCKRACCIRFHICY